MEEKQFHGISLGWMQAQWRDCADKDEQLKIFIDMTGATADEIIAELEPEFIPRASARRNKNKPWTPEEDARLLEMKAAKVREADIASRLGRPFNAVHARYGLLKKEARRKEEREIDMTEDNPENVEEVLIQPETETGEEVFIQLETETEADENSIPKPDAEIVFAAMGQYISVLKTKEALLTEELDAVHEELKMYIDKLKELLKLAGGMLTK